MAETTRKHDLAIGELLEAALDNDVKKVLGKYRHELNYNANHKNLKTFVNTTLEKCADFLQLKVRSDGPEKNQMYPNKDTLVDRIIIKMESFLETICDECNSPYRNKLGGENPPLSCFLCYQGSHDCQQMHEKYDRFKDLLISPDRLMGVNWMCHGCREKNDIALTPKTKTHNLETTASVSQADIPQTPIEDEEAALDQVEGDISRRSPRRDRDRNTSNPPEICPLYKKMKCPHGLTGKREINGAPCQKRHPPRCLTYCRFAKDSKRGCTKGKECKYFHPTLCKHSVKRRVCTVKDCTFTHLKGTKKYDPDNQKSQKIIQPEKYMEMSERPETGRSILFRTPSIHPPISRNQNLPPQKTIPKRMADAQGTELSFLSELPMILNSLQRQQQEMKEHLMRLTDCTQPDPRHSYQSSHPPMHPQQPLPLYRDVLLRQHQPWTTTAQAPQPSHPSMC